MNSYRAPVHLHLFFTRVKNETRLEKSSFCFNRLDYRATSVVPTLLAASEINSLTSVRSLRAVPGFLFSKSFIHKFPFPLRKLFALVNIIYFLCRSLFCIISVRPSIVSVHNPELLIFTPLLWLIRLVFGSVLFYEPHELEVCKTDVQYNPFRRFLIFTIESLMLPVFDVTILVSDSIAEFYSDIYGISNSFVLPNIPLILKSPDTSDLADFYDHFSLKRHFSIADDVPVFIYQGLLSVSRGLRDLVSVFSAQSSSALVLMGYGEMQDEIIAFTNIYPNIFFLPAVPPEYIVSVTSSADFGIFYIPSSLNPSRSYRYSMPNKFFEYLSSGLPIVSSSNLVDISSIISAHSLGYSSLPDNESLAQMISNISSDYPVSKQKFTQSVRNYASTFSYTHLYDKLMAKVNF